MPDKVAIGRLCHHMIPHDPSLVCINKNIIKNYILYL